LPEFGFNMAPATWTADGPAQRAGRQRIVAAFAAAQQKKKLRFLEMKAAEREQRKTA
jgi:hypothetical protein